MIIKFESVELYNEWIEKNKRDLVYLETKINLAYYNNALRVIYHIIYEPMSRATETEHKIPDYVAPEKEKVIYEKKEWSACCLQSIQNSTGNQIHCNVCNRDHEVMR